MLPEPTIPKRRRAAPAQPQPWAMTPLFAVPDSPDGIMPPGRQDARPPGRARRPNSRPASPQKSHKEPADLLLVTAERLRRALGRSFLRYGISGDLETAAAQEADGRQASRPVIPPVAAPR